MTPWLAATTAKRRGLAGVRRGHAEKLRDKFVAASTEAEKKAVAEEVQRYAMQIVTHVPLGERHDVGAVRDNLIYPAVLPPVTVFWGVTKK
jgi:peptide/nickel transport system substrate-binding protein